MPHFVYLHWSNQRINFTQHAYQLGKLLCRNLALVSAYQADRYEPFGSSKASRLENRLVCRRNLPTALGALMQMTVLQLPELVVTALGADESVFPAIPVQLFQTSRPS